MTALNPTQVTAKTPTSHDGVQPNGEIGRLAFAMQRTQREDADRSVARTILAAAGGLALTAAAKGAKREPVLETIETALRADHAKLMEAE
jgi:hypothetical protein